MTAAAEILVEFLILIGIVSGAPPLSFRPADILWHFKSSAERLFLVS